MSSAASSMADRDAESLGRSVLDSSSDCIVVLDLEGRIRYLNPAGTRILGLDVERLRGLRWLDFWDQATEGAIEAVTQARRGMVGRFRGLRSPVGGSQTTWDVVVSPILDDQRRVEQLLAVARDVTEQHRLEARLRTVIETEPECVKLVARDGALLEMNAAGLAMIEAGSARDVVGKCVFDLVAPADRAAFRAMHARVCDGSSQTLEFEIVGLRGARRRMETHAVPLRVENQQGFVHLAITRDVTHARAVELALRESDARLRMALNAARMGTWEWNLGSHDLRCSELVAPIMGATEATLSISLERLRSLVHPADRARVEGAIDAALSGAVAVHSIELRVLWPDESVHWVEAKGRVYRDDQRRALRMAGVVTDVTDRKRTEEVLRITEERLRQSQKMEAIGRLAGGIAHDFNNLLTAIGGFSALALDRLEADSPVRSDIDEIQRASDQAAALTRQLLAFSRQQVLTPKLLELNAVVGGVQGLLRRLIGENIELACSFGAELGVVRADPGQIEQVILNLAVNARDAMPQGGRLTIETANVDFDEQAATRNVGVRPGTFVMIAVTDSGEGMDAETQANIFEPFFTTKALGHGTGLGLSTVYGIIDQSGGFSTVYSEPGLGTTFKVYLPRVREGASVARAGGQENPQPDAGDETILLVEDNDGVRRLAHQALASRGYRVLIASNGFEALTVAARHSGRIDLLLTDVVMPGMGGRELVDRLLPSRPETKVILMSGYTDDTAIQNGALDRSTTFVQKPFSPGSLAAKVRAVLDAEPARVPSVRTS